MEVLTSTTAEVVFGEAGTLRTRFTPIVPLPAGCVRVELVAAGVNFLDVYERSNRTGPYAAGREGAGRIIELAEGVQGLGIGDCVVWAMAPASWGTSVVVAADRCLRVPQGLSLHTAAAGLLQAMTARVLVHEVVGSRLGSTALVHAGAGGLGRLLIQTLAREGVSVIATCSNKDKAEVARQAGADHVIMPSEVPIEEVVRDLTQGTGVSVVFDGVGRTTFASSLASVATRGWLVLHGTASGTVDSISPQDLQARGSVTFVRPALAHYIKDRAELEHHGSMALESLARNELSVLIDRVLRLDQANDAVNALAGRQIMGKVLLSPTGE